MTNLNPTCPTRPLPYGTPYADGHAAGLARAPVGDVPYSEHDPRHWAWLRGWISGHGCGFAHGEPAPEPSDVAPPAKTAAGP